MRASAHQASLTSHEQQERIRTLEEDVRQRELKIASTEKSVSALSAQVETLEAERSNALQATASAQKSEESARALYLAEEQVRVRLSERVEQLEEESAEYLNELMMIKGTDMTSATTASMPDIDFDTDEYDNDAAPALKSTDEATWSNDNTSHVSLQIALDEAQRWSREVERRNEELEADCRQRNAEKASLSQSLEATQLQLDSLRQLSDDAQRQQRVDAAELGRVKQLLDETHNSFTSACEELENTKSITVNTRSMLDQSIRARSDAEASLSMCQLSLHTAESRVEELSNENSSLSDRLRVVKSELREANGKLHAMKKEVAATARSVKAKQNGIDILTSERDDWKAAYERVSIDTSYDVIETYLYPMYL
jgi:chromosome segregation ATPase